MSDQGKMPVVLACLLVMFAGCSSTPPKPLPDGTFTPEPEVTIPTNTVATTPKPATNLSPVPAPPAKGSTNKFDYSPVWVSLERWCHGYGYAMPRRQVAEGAITYSVLFTNGSMKIQIGSQVASWRGIDYRLGFAPQLIDGHPYVNSLDLRKNFLPLLEKPFWTATNRFIVIDPGHGGEDIGARNVYNGHFEKEFTLDWARRIESILVTNGWKVILTRTNDVKIKPKERATFAEEHKADFFISLHFNSALPDQQVSGLETYCLTPKGMPSTLPRGYRDDSSLTFPNNEFDTENMQLAAVLHRELLKVNGNNDRGVRRARFLGALQGQSRPAVLIEGGYLSNPKEAKRIADPAYREKLAEAVAQALNEETAGALNIMTPPPLVLHQTNSQIHVQGTNSGVVR